LLLAKLLLKTPFSQDYTFKGIIYYNIYNYLLSCLSEFLYKSDQRGKMTTPVKNEMKKNKFENTRRKLLEMQQNIIRESKVEINQMLNKGDKYNGLSDDGDLADVAITDSLQATNLNRHRATLRAIEEALLRIDEGTYGTCEDCGEEIAVGRLNAVPFALRCVECQEIQEVTVTESEE
jgi:DnaK suppressor protein